MKSQKNVHSNFDTFDTQQDLEIYNFLTLLRNYYSLLRNLKIDL